MTSPLGTPRERCDEYSSKIFPQLRNQGLSFRRGADKRLKVMLASFTTALDNLYGASSKLCFARSNMEPAHTQPNILFPTCDKVVNLTGLLETKGMSVSRGKQ
jgi:hypothetical protein